MDVVPHLAWLAQKHQQSSLEAWKRRWDQAEEDKEEGRGGENKKNEGRKTAAEEDGREGETTLGRTRSSELSSSSSSPLSLLDQVRRLHQKKKLWRAPQQVLSVYEQQRMLIGNVGFLDPLAQKKRETFHRKRTWREIGEEERQMNLLRTAAARTRTVSGFRGDLEGHTRKEEGWTVNPERCKHPDQSSPGGHYVC